MDQDGITIVDMRKNRERAIVLRVTELELRDIKRVAESKRTSLSELVRQAVFAVVDAHNTGRAA